MGLITGVWVLYKRLTTTNLSSAWLLKIREIITQFVEGLMSIKKLERPVLFVGYTVLIWVGYITMMYIPFWMFDLPLKFDLGWQMPQF